MADNTDATSSVLHKQSVVITATRGLSVAGWAAAFWIFGAMLAPTVPSISAAGAVIAMGLVTLLALLVVLPLVLLVRFARPTRWWLARVVSSGEASRSALRWVWILAFVGLPVGSYYAILPYCSAHYDLPSSVAMVFGLPAAIAVMWLIHRVVTQWTQTPRLGPTPIALLVLIAVWIVWLWAVPVVIPGYRALTFIVAVLVSSIGIASVGTELPIRLRNLGTAAGIVVCVVGIAAALAFPLGDAVSHPAANSSLLLLQGIADIDGDGFSAILGGGDCDDGNPEIHPMAIEIVGNGIDENCSNAEPTSVDPLPRSDPNLANLASAPDIVLIGIDSLRADRFTPELMPNLWQFAQGGLYCTRAYSPGPFTDFSFRSIFTGWPPSDYDFSGNLIGMDFTLAELLSQVGYRSFALHAVDELGELVTLGFQFANRSLAPRHANSGSGSSAVEMTDLAFDLLSAPREGPRFVWVHYQELHLRHIPHPGFERLGSDQQGLYNQEVAFLDHSIQPLLQWLSRPEVADSTVVVVFADHGEHLGERGLVGHPLTSYEPGVRVPLIIRSAHLQPTVVETSVSLLDIFPTVLELAGISGVEQRAGRSLVQPAVERTIFTEGRNDDGSRAFISARRAGYLLHCSELTQHCELFDIEEDPDSEHDISSTHRQLYDQLRTELGQFADEYRNDVRILARRDAWIERMSLGSAGGP